MGFKKHEREDVLNKYDSKCAYCGEDINLKNMQVDHIIPQSWFEGHIKNNFKVPAFLSHLTENDVNHIDNLNPACRVCNKWKSSFDLEFFRDEILAQVKRLNAYSSNYRMAKRYGLVTECSYPITFYFERAPEKLRGLRDGFEYAQVHSRDREELLIKYIRKIIEVCDASNPLINQSAAINATKALCEEALSGTQPATESPRSNKVHELKRGLSKLKSEQK